MAKQVTMEDKVMEIAMKHINPEVPKGKIGLDAEWGEMGINSLKFTHLLVALETEFGFETEDEKLHISNYNNLRALIDYIKTKIA